MYLPVFILIHGIVKYVFIPTNVNMSFHNPLCVYTVPAPAPFCIIRKTDHWTLDTDSTLTSTHQM